MNHSVYETNGPAHGAPLKTHQRGHAWDQGPPSQDGRIVQGNRQESQTENPRYNMPDDATAPEHSNPWFYGGPFSAAALVPQHSAADHCATGRLPLLGLQNGTDDFEIRGAGVHAADQNDLHAGALGIIDRLDAQRLLVRTAAMVGATE
jgi:hypothetical protein